MNGRQRTEYQKRMDDLFAKWISGKYLADAEQEELAAYAIGKRDENGNVKPEPAQPQVPA
jgi:hypothetical protein